MFLTYPEGTTDVASIRIRRCPDNPGRFRAYGYRDASILRNIFGCRYFLEADYERVLKAVSHWGFSLEEACDDSRRMEENA